MVGRSRQLRLGAVTFGTAAITLASGCGVITSGTERETVVIAADLELTGDGSALGTVYRDALQLRVDQINEQELLGDRDLELRVVDNRSDPATAATNIAELAGDSSVTAIITGHCSDCVIGAAETIETRGVPTVALAHANAVSEPIDERRFIFKLGLNAENNAAALIRELVRVDATTIGLVTTTDAYGTDGQTAMEEAAQRADVNIAVSAQVDGETESVQGAAAQIAAHREDGEIDPATGLQQEPASVDAVVVWAPGPSASEFAVALRDQEYEGPLLFDASAADQLFLGVDAQAALDDTRMIFTETLVIDNVIATSPAKAARQTWFNDYTAQYGTYHAYSSFAADAVEVIVDAINQRDSTDRAVVREAIEGTLLDGFSGPLRLSIANHSGLSPQALTTVVVQGDRWRLATS
jgi:branched-chain amino acid transport system substrate-binding protein